MSQDLADPPIQRRPAPLARVILRRNPAAVAPSWPMGVDGSGCEDTAPGPSEASLAERPRLAAAVREGNLALKLAGVGLIGFAVDAALLHAVVGLGLSPAWARVISLSAAMQVTFVINGLRVFRCLDRATLLRQWAGYMAASGFGNFCNYWIFVTMVSTHWWIVSNHMVALAVGSFMAWLINYVGARFVVFGPPRPGRRMGGLGPAFVEDASN
jgi:putative flippase GtrA